MPAAIPAAPLGACPRAATPALALPLPCASAHAHAAKQGTKDYRILIVDLITNKLMSKCLEKTEIFNEHIHSLEYLH